jgi:hypothetical protein
VSGRRQVSLPEGLCAAAEQRFGGEFQSVEALIEFVLRELLRDDARKLDLQEKEILEQRLRDLGYI